MNFYAPKPKNFPLALQAECPVCGKRRADPKHNGKRCSAIMKQRSQKEKETAKE
jgi:hypothetical protein